MAIENRFAARSAPEYLAYKASTYHWDLFEKYRDAAATPWFCVNDDPPPPQLANPRFKADSSDEQEVRDWGKPQPGGMQ
jgi:hypothetical protein